MQVGALRAIGVLGVIALAGCQHLRDQRTIEKERMALESFLDRIPECAPGEWRPEAHFSASTSHEFPPGVFTLNGVLRPTSGVCTLLDCPGLPEACCNGCGGRWALVDEAATLPLIDAENGTEWSWGAMDCTLHALGEGHPSREVQVTGSFSNLALQVARVCARPATEIEAAQRGTQREVQWHVPTRLVVAPNEPGGATVNYDAASEQMISFRADPGITLGLRTRLFVVVSGQRRSLGEDLDGGPTFAPWTVRPEELPAKPPYSFEVEITVFETDIPPEHEWSPQRGAHYREVWSSTITTPARQ